MNPDVYSGDRIVTSVSLLVRNILYGIQIRDSLSSHLGLAMGASVKEEENHSILTTGFQL